MIRSSNLNVSCICSWLVKEHGSGLRSRAPQAMREPRNLGKVELLYIDSERASGQHHNEVEAWRPALTEGSITWCSTTSATQIIQGLRKR